MATKYLRNVTTANWSADTAWSLSSGGPNDTTHPVDGDAVILDANSGTTTLTVDVSSAATSLVMTGFTGTFAGSAALQLKGNLTSVAGMAGYTYSGTITIANTTGTATLSSAGHTLCGALTCNAPGGTLTFADAFVTTGTCTLVAGTWNDGNQTLVMSAWVNTGAATRVIVYGTSNTWYVTGSGTCWNESGTGCTANAVTRQTAGGKNGLTTIDFNYSGSSARTQIRDSEFAWVMPKVKVSAGSGTFTMGAAAGTRVGGIYAHGLDFTGFSGTYTPAATSGGTYFYYWVCVGDCTLSSTMTLTSCPSNAQGQCNFIGSRLTAGEAAYVTMAGKTIPMSGAGVGYGTWFNPIVAAGSLELTDNFATNDRITFNVGTGAGSLVATANVTGELFDSSTTTTRTITMGSGTWTLTSTAATTVWSMATTTGLTLNANTATIALTGVTANTRTISANSVQLPSIAVNAGSGAVTFTNVNCDSLTFGNSYSGTVANQTITIRGNVQLSNHASFALTAGANAWTLAATSTGKTFTSQGKTIDFPLVFNGVGGGWTMQDALTHGITRTLTVTAGALSFGTGLTHTMGFFSSSNSNVRTIDSGTSTLNFPTTGTVFDTSTSTNLTMAGTGTIALTANSATARTITGGSALLPSLSMATGSFAPTFTNCNFLNLTIMSGYTGTIANQAITLRGTVSLAATGATYSAGSSAWTWANTSGTVTWASNGRTLDFPIIVNGSATHQFADNLTLGSSRALTLTAGTLALASYTATAQNFSSSGTGTRTLATGTGTLALGGTGVAYDTGTATNMTVTGAGTIKLTNSSGTARSLDAGGMTLPNVWVSAGTSTTTATNVAGVLDLNFTGMGAGTWSCGAGTFTIGGSLTLVSAMTYSCAANLTWNATSTGKTITSWGKSWTSGTVTFSGSGGGWTLQDAPATFTLANALTVAVGHLNTNGYAVTTPALVFSGSGTRTLALGASTITLTGTGTVLDASGTNQTVNAGTSIVSQTDGTSTLKTLNLGGKTWATVRAKKSGTNRVALAGDGSTFAFDLAA